jgi:hypothetical protein
VRGRARDATLVFIVVSRRRAGERAVVRQCVPRFCFTFHEIRRIRGAAMGHTTCFVRPMSKLREGSVLAGLVGSMLLSSACGSATTTSNEPGSSGGSNHTNAGESGLDAGGRNAGGSNLGNAGAGGGNAGAGGGNAGAGGNAKGGCRSSADCPTQSGLGVFGAPQCLTPDQATPATLCGAPGWCGRCDCPPPPVAPEGNGMVCQSNADCPAPSADGKRASSCEQGACTECASDLDCPALMPFCGTVQSVFGPSSFGSFRSCAQCLTDEQCSEATPHCLLTNGVGRCVACISHQECAQGVCDQGSCVAGCGPNQACTNRFAECAPSQRCEARVCANDSECPPPNAACTSGRCQRRACQDDATCDAGGSCVQGACYEAPGRCFQQMGAP